MKEITIERFNKAERSIHSARNLVEDGDLDFAASRAYYAMFYAAEALLDEKDLQFSKHGGVHGAFALHFVKTGIFEPKYHQWLVTAFNQRITGDYGIVADFDEEIVLELIQHAEEFVEAGKKYLGIN